MTQVWIYTLASSSDPDRVTCVVPRQVDEDMIFFGPCKKKIRERLRREYLIGNRNHATVADGIYIIGVNGSNSDRDRKVVVAGEVREVMTFAEADGRLVGERFQELREYQVSPLHVRPIVQNGELVGYSHVSDLHLQDDAWIADLTSNQRRVNTQGRAVLRRPGVSVAQAFDRDCCMLLDNIFFAQGRGIEFDKEAMDILKEAQPDRKGIDEYAIFGLRNDGTADGRTGAYLEINGPLADRFVAWLRDRASPMQRYQEDINPVRKSCHPQSPTKPGVC